MKLVAGLTVMLLVVGLPIYFLQTIINQVIQSEQFKPWLQAQIESSSIGGTFDYERIEGNLFGMTLHGIKFKNGEPDANILSAKAKTARATFDLLPLVAWQLQLTGLHLKDAQIEMRIHGGKAENIKLPVRLNRISLEKSSVRISNLSQWDAKILLADVDLVQSGTGEGMKVDVKMEAGSMKIGAFDLLRLKFKGGFFQEKLLAEQFESEFVKGKILLSGNLVLDGKASFVMEKLQIDGARIESVFGQLSMGDQFKGNLKLFSNKIEGVLTPKIRRLSGQGKVEVKDTTASVAFDRGAFAKKAGGKMGGDAGKIPLFGSLVKGVGEIGAGVAGGAFGGKLVEHLTPAQIVKGEAKFALENQNITIAEGIFETSHAKIKLSGTSNLSGEFRMQGQLDADQEISGDIPIAGDFIQETPGKGRLIPFILVGETSAPRAEP